MEQGNFNAQFFVFYTIYSHLWVTSPHNLNTYCIKTTENKENKPILPSIPVCFSVFLHHPNLPMLQSSASSSFSGSSAGEERRLMGRFTTFEGRVAEVTVAVGAEAVVLRAPAAAALPPRALLLAPAAGLRVLGPLGPLEERSASAGRLEMARSLYAAPGPDVAMPAAARGTC